MSTADIIDEAVQLLKELGLKEYEARCFIGLTRLDVGTAKTLSEFTAVPRSRVYDAIRILESKDLVQVHHSSPQRFRAVSFQEATETLRDQYDDRVQRLQTILEMLESSSAGQNGSHVQEVWTLSGTDAVERRTLELIECPATEVILIIGDDSVLSDELVDSLDGIRPGVDLFIGALTHSVQHRIQESVPDAKTFISGLAWLQEEHRHEDDPAIGRLLLVDHSAILFSTIEPATDQEQAIVGEGFGNGLIGVARRIVAPLSRHRRDSLP